MNDFETMDSIVSSVLAALPSTFKTPAQQGLKAGAGDDPQNLFVLLVLVRHEARIILRNFALSDTIRATIEKVGGTVSDMPGKRCMAKFDGAIVSMDSKFSQGHIGCFASRHPRPIE